MSKSYKHLPVVKVTPRVLNLNPSTAIIAEQGPKSSDYQYFTTSSNSNSRLAFNVDVDERNVIGRYAEVYTLCTLSATGTADVGKKFLNFGTTTALRPFPMHQISESLNTTMNGQVVETVQCRDILSALLHVYSDGLSENCDACPYMLDNCANYNDFIGTPQNVLGNYTQALIGERKIPRGAYVVTIINNPVGQGPNTPVTAVIQFQISEPVMCAPFVWTREESEGLTHCNKMQVSFSISDFSRAISNSSIDGSVITSVAGGGSYGGSTYPAFAEPTLRVEVLSPNELMTIPKSITLPYYTQDVNTIANFPAIAPGASAVLNSGLFPLKEVPGTVYIWARDSNDTRTCQTPDRFLTFSNINFNINDTPGILTNYTPQKMYRICRKNGVQMSWLNWNGLATGVNGASVGTCGSVLRLKFGSDIPLKTGVSPGQDDSTRVTYKYTVVNNTSSTITPQLFTVFVQGGIITNSIGNHTDVNVGILTQSDVLNAKEVPLSAVGDEDPTGGNFLGSFKKGWNSYVAPVASALKTGLDLADKAGLLKSGGDLVVDGHRSQMGGAVKNKKVGKGKYY